MTTVHDLTKKKDVKVISLNTTNDGGLDFFEALALLFIGLKLTDHLQTWTWIEVLSPIWGPFMLGWFVKLIRLTFFSQVKVDND
jgi:hypothetical protein